MADPSLLSPMFSFLGWAFLPTYATSLIQSVYYKVTIRAGVQHPQPGTPRFAQDHRRIRVIVLSLYLIYTLLQSLYDVKIQGDFYTILGLSPHKLSDREIRSKFRRLAAKYHPDKLNAAAGQPSTSANPATASTAAESHFLALKLAQDTLLSPNLRYAYTHFGPSITTIHLPNPHSTPISSYVYAGLRQSIPSYAINILSLIVLNYFVLPKSGQYWRYLIVGFSAWIEIYLLTHDNPLSAFSSSTMSTWPAPLTTLVHFLTPSQLTDILPPHLLPYQLLQISRTLGISLNIFISQVASLTRPPAPNATSAASHAQFLTALTHNLSNLQTLAGRTDKESTDVLKLQLAPFKGDPEKVVELRRGMREGMILGVAKASPDVQVAVHHALERRRQQNMKSSLEIEREEMLRSTWDDRPEVEIGDGSDVVDLLNSDVHL